MIIENLNKPFLAKVLNQQFKYLDDSEANLAPKLLEVLMITSYPPRECGIATYSQDLILALNNKFNNTFNITICALETDTEKHNYNSNIKYKLNTRLQNDYINLSIEINNSAADIVLIQHEFGFFENNENNFLSFLNSLNKPIAIVFHTVLPNPNEQLKLHVSNIASVCNNIIVMTNNSLSILENDYNINRNKISVIPHGTHLVKHIDKEKLKEKYQLSGRNVLSTFGLLSSGKNIETTLAALPAIIEADATAIFLIIGKTHPSVVKSEGESYRAMLEEKVHSLRLQNHVKFINSFLSLPDLLDYLLLTDIYLFTSKDPNQAVSGTFSYAISCGCPIISTPIPHALEVLRNDAGIVIDFENSEQLAEATIRLLLNENLRNNISATGTHRIASTAWENSAIAHAILFQEMSNDKINLNYSLPEINLDHIKKMTTEFGMIQFSILNKPDITSGYTLDDNARALIAMCKHYKLTLCETDLQYIETYFDFIEYCMQKNGKFLNYVDAEKRFTIQNDLTNLADANGRAIWALGYLISLSDILPIHIIQNADLLFNKAIAKTTMDCSTRAMAFSIKGLYYYNINTPNQSNKILVKELANRLVQMYKHESEHGWEWFESYLTYANSVLPEALLCAYLVTDEIEYKDIARKSFDFLLGKMFSGNSMRVISNQGWSHKGDVNLRKGGQQPIDVAYTIIAFQKFHTVFGTHYYRQKNKIAFDWFLGRNHLHQVIYNAATGGCYDGLEENNVNLNQGAESAVSYLMARLILEEDLINATIDEALFNYNKDLLEVLN